MEIRKAVHTDLEDIMRIYECAGEFMRRTGNPRQWAGGYPGRALVEEDIQKGHCFVLTESGDVHGVFAFIVGEDSTYAVIENGSWMNNAPYGTIHRLAGDGRVRGIFSHCAAFCRAQIPNLRADTHTDNTVMRHLLEKNGFSPCGTVYVRDKSPRIAYQWTADAQRSGVNRLISPSSAEACADSSPLVAEASSAVAELDCTTSEI